MNKNRNVHPSFKYTYCPVVFFAILQSSLALMFIYYRYQPLFTQIIINKTDAALQLYILMAIKLINREIYCVYNKLFLLAVVSIFIYIDGRIIFR